VACNTIAFSLNQIIPGNCGLMRGAGHCAIFPAFMTEKILTTLFIFINSVISTTGYAGVAFLMGIESACVPLPSELIMPFAGYLVSTGRFNLLWVATAGAIGCNLGSLVAYEIGRYGGRPLVERYGRWVLMGRRELDWADRFFLRWGYLAVFIARLLPVIRTFIALPAGVARMPRGRFHVYTFLGSWPWCLALAYFGMKLGQNWRTMGKYFHRFDDVIIVGLIVGIVWFVWTHWQNRIGRQVPAAGD
jgi:membrane protein DedA with SNARE-associated domain